MTRSGPDARRAPDVFGAVSGQLGSALRLLTRIPIPGAAGDATGAAAFGFIGGLIGLAGAGAILLLGPRAPVAAGAAAVAVMAILSGGLHLDGLADTLDALAAPTVEAAARARTDPRVGAAGAAAIVIVILLDAGLLAGLVDRDGATRAALACVVATAGSRAVAPLLAVAVRRPTVGSVLGGWFAARTSVPAALVATGSAAVIGAAAAWIGSSPGPLVALLAGAIIAIGIGGWLARARGGIDGDALGALIELGFSAILLAAVLVP